MQRPALDPDDMVWRGNPSGREICKVAALEKFQNGTVCPHIKDRHGRGVTPAAPCQRPTKVHDRIWNGIIVPRRNVSQSIQTHRCRCHIGMVDNAVIALFCGITKSEMPMLEKQQTLDIRVRLVNISRRLGKCETGHDVGHYTKPVTKDFTAPLRGIWQIGQNQKCRCVSVIDIGMRQIGMQ